MIRIAKCAALLAAMTLAGCTSPLSSTGPSMSPNFIAAGDCDGWPNAYELQNKNMRVVIAPDVGRIAVIDPYERGNVLRGDAELARRSAKTGIMPPFLNVGGDWLWPAAQPAWTNIAGSNWPPPPVLANRPWTGSAWKGDDGTQYCLLAREFGAPLNLEVTRLIELDPELARLTIRQRSIRKMPSNIPVTLWSISQIQEAEQVFLPIGPYSVFTNGLACLMFGTPPESHLTYCEGIAVYDCTQGGQYKLGSDSARAWIAARKGDILVLERSEDNPEGVYPDGGCALEMYSNSGFGYTEIETLSPEIPLDRDSSLANKLVIECHVFPTNLAPCEAADRVSELAGEA